VAHVGEHVIARVEDAGVLAAGGPARIALSRLPREPEVADAVASARGVSDNHAGRLVVTADPSRLIDAAGRVGGTQLAQMVEAAIEPALAAWSSPPPDLVTPRGVLPTSERPVVMGVLNVTPDSFSDGGRFADAQAAVAAGRVLLAEGADVIDVGGESTRPGASAVSAAEELERVLPVVGPLADDGAIVSIDTVKSAVARAAVGAGAAIVNDVSSGTLDPELLPAVAELGVPYVLTHLRGTPETMQDDPHYDDVVGEVYDHLADRLCELEELGIPAERVVVDPGIGFGKRLEDNLMLLNRIRELTSLGRPVLIGASRKAFIGTIAGIPDPRDRLPGSLVVAGLAVANGASIIRAHDVADTVQAVAVAQAISSATPRH
jgi:dihydropteroate synthase